MKILFQGDSITDAWRTKDTDDSFGIGYAILVKANLGITGPDKYEFVNRGIRGNRIVDIYARMKSDIINIKPDVMSILVGVNDALYEISEPANGVDAEKYYKIYDMLIDEIKTELPDIKIMIMESFVLRNPDWDDETWEKLRKEVELRAEKAKEIAKKHNLTFIPLQKGFDELAKQYSPMHWTGDGIHPTTIGHEYIKNEWLKAFKTL